MRIWQLIWKEIVELKIVQTLPTKMYGHKKFCFGLILLKNKTKNTSVFKYQLKLKKCLFPLRILHIKY